MTYPEVEAFRKASEEAGVTYDAAYMAAGPLEETDGYTAYCKAVETAKREYSVSVNTAWNQMKLDASEPLVAWIVDECKEWQSHALRILKALPASTDELGVIAADGGWCSVYDAFVERAVQAGVVRELSPISEARGELREWFRLNYSSQRHALSRLMELVDAVVAAETGNAAPVSTDAEEDVLRLDDSHVGTIVIGARLD